MRMEDVTGQPGGGNQTKAASPLNNHHVSLEVFQPISEWVCRLEQYHELSIIQLILDIQKDIHNYLNLVNAGFFPCTPLVRAPIPSPTL